VGDNTVDLFVGEIEAAYSGGNAFNVAVQIKRAGGAVRYFGALGADARSRFILHGLQANGLDTDGVVRLDGETAITKIRLTPDGDRVFESEDFGVTADYYPDAASFRAIAQADWIHIGMLPRADEFRRALTAVGSTATVSQDCAVSAGSDNLDVGFFSAGADGDAETTAADAVSKGIGLAVVTRGAEGAIAYDGDHWWAQPAVPATIVDTTGAGDSFIAGFIVSRLRGRDVSSSLEMGAQRAAIAVGHMAGWPHPPRPLREDLAR
jgi:fructoselysine 6-kinase